MAVIGVAGFFLLYILIICAAIAMSVLSGVAIYRDAKSIGRDDGVLFGVLTGLFGVIPACVYLAIRGRRKGVGVCPNCAAQYGGIELGNAIAPLCSRCGSVLTLYHAQVTAEEQLAAEKSRRTNKALCVVTIIAYAVSLLFFVGMFIGMFYLISVSAY